MNLSPISQDYFSKEQGGEIHIVVAPTVSARAGAIDQSPEISTRLSLLAVG